MNTPHVYVNSYRQAMEELESILADLENTPTDLDELIAKVQRASDLIKVCKKKIRSAEDSVNKVFEDIDEENEQSL